MQCQGKCHLKKELKEQEEKDQSPVNPTNGKQQTVQFHQSIHQFSLQSFDTETGFQVICLIGKPQSPGFSIFHPPTV